MRRYTVDKVQTLETPKNVQEWLMHGTPAHSTRAVVDEPWRTTWGTTFWSAGTSCWSRLVRSADGLVAGIPLLKPDHASPEIA